MINIAICDGDEKEANELKLEIEKILNGNTRVFVFNNPFALITHILDEAKGQVDIVFLELCFKNQNGVNVAETIINEYPYIKIIFVTGQIERVKDIFRIDPSYFLTKPIEYKYLRDALEKTLRLVDENNMDILKIGSGVGKNRIITVKLRDIYFIKSDRRKIIFNMNDSQYSCYMKLDDVIKELNHKFIRVHQSYIINMDKIKEVGNGNITLNNNTVVPISYSKHKVVIEEIKKYLEM